jgi:hypothetical protein
MAEPVLNRPCIVPGVGQCIAACMAKHVDVDLERQARAAADTFYKAVDGVRRERAAAFASPLPAITSPSGP